MNKLITLATLAGLTCSSIALANSNLPNSTTVGPYVGIRGDIAILGGPGSDAFKVGPIFGAQVGYKWNRMRLEAAFSYLWNNASYFNDAALHMTNVMANVYFDINTGTRFTPFIGGGIGVTNMWVKSHHIAFPTKSKLAYQGIAGLAFKLNKNIALEASYRYLNWSEFSGSQNLVQVGVNYYF